MKQNGTPSSLSSSLCYYLCYYRVCILYSSYIWVVNVPCSNCMLRERNHTTTTVVYPVYLCSVHKRVWAMFSRCYVRASFTYVREHYGHVEKYLHVGMSHIHLLLSVQWLYDVDQTMPMHALLKGNKSFVNFILI